MNTEKDAKDLNEALSYARWLGYIEFERLVDNKNDEPIIIPAPASARSGGRMSRADSLDIDSLDPSTLGVSASLEDFEPRQPYRLVFFGEKTSLKDVLGPLGEEFSADLYLGDRPDQQRPPLQHRQGLGAADGRPTVVFTFSDRDPSGYWDMPISIAHKPAGAARSPLPELQVYRGSGWRSARHRCVASPCPRRHSRRAKGAPPTGRRCTACSRPRSTRWRSCAPTCCALSTRDGRHALFRCGPR